MPTHILFTNATLITPVPSTTTTSNAPPSLQILHNHSLLTTSSHITAIGPTPTIQPPTPETQIVSCTGKILTPGFINTHTHTWQTAYRTLGPDVTLSEYFTRFSQYSPAATTLFASDNDVFVSTLTGYLEGLNAGTTTFVEHAHANWGLRAMEATYEAAGASGGRVWWCCAAEAREGVRVEEARGVMEKVRDRNEGAEDALVRLGYAWDGFGVVAGDEEKVAREKDIIKDVKAEVLTFHHLSEPWKLGSNSPALAHAAPATLQELNIPAIFSHAPNICPSEIAALRAADWNLSITPESEMHYGHGQKTSAQILDQASLGTDTPFTFSGDMLTQARLYLQHVRANEYQRILDDGGKAPRRSPMGVEDAFLLMTRQGGRALRRDDLGVLRVGAKADVVVFDAGSPNMVGWRDAVAAVVLHANVGDVESVLVDGVWRKKGGKLVGVDWEGVKAQFEEVARRVQEGMERLDEEMGVPEETKGPFGGAMEWGEPEVFSTKGPEGGA